MCGGWVCADMSVLCYVCLLTVLLLFLALVVEILVRIFLCHFSCAFLLLITGQTLTTMMKETNCSGTFVSACLRHEAGWGGRSSGLIGWAAEVTSMQYFCFSLFFSQVWRWNRRLQWQRALCQVGEWIRRNRCARKGCRGAVLLKQRLPPCCSPSPLWFLFFTLKHLFILVVIFGPVF